MAIKVKKNGHKAKVEAALDKTIEQVTKAPQAKPLMPSAVEGAFRHNTQTSAIDYILTPGKDINEFGLRSEIPDKDTDGMVRATCLAIGQANAEKYNSEYVQQVIWYSLNLWPAVNGHRIDQAIRGITGANPNNPAMQKGRGLGEKIKNYAFPNKNEGKEE